MNVATTKWWVEDTGFDTRAEAEAYAKSLNGFWRIVEVTSRVVFSSTDHDEARAIAARILDLLHGVNPGKSPWPEIRAARDALTERDVTALLRNMERLHSLVRDMREYFP